MIVSPGTFQVMAINSIGKIENKYEMYIDNKKITIKHSITSSASDTR